MGDKNPKKREKKKKKIEKLEIVLESTVTSIKKTK